MRPTKLKRQFVETLRLRIAERSPLLQIVLGAKQAGKTTGIEQLIAASPSHYHFVSTDEVLSPGPA